MLMVECIDDSVDGLSKHRLYKVINTRLREDGSLNYFLFDDYGHYNEFISNIFRIEDYYVELSKENQI